VQLLILLLILLLIQLLVCTRMQKMMQRRGCRQWFVACAGAANIKGKARVR
jgi:hypothetical protein